VTLAFLGENLIAKEFGDFKVWCGKKWNVAICGEISVWQFVEKKIVFWMKLINGVYMKENTYIWDH